MWQVGSLPLTVDLLVAIIVWPPVEPEDLRCPTLWLVEAFEFHSKGLVKFGTSIEIVLRTEFVSQKQAGPARLRMAPSLLLGRACQADLTREVTLDRDPIGA